MQGSFKAGMKDGKMRMELDPEGGKFSITTKQGAIRKIKDRKKAEKTRMGTAYTERSLKEYILRTQARFYRLVIG